MTRYEVAPGYSINVEVAGEGPPIVLLHGFTGAAKSWGEFGRLLAERFTTVALDIAGHGETDSPEELDHYRMGRVVHDLVEAARLAGFERAIWLGYSMGGRTALHVAATHPEAVERLVVIGGSPGLATEAERQARIASDEELADRIERDGVPAFVEYWENLPLFATQKRLPSAVQTEVRRARLRCNATGLANSLRGMGTGAQAPLFDRLAEFELPVLLMAGAEDLKFKAIAKEMDAAMPDADLEIVPRSGHAAQLEQPEHCARLVRAFVEHHSPQGVAR